jgi:hypothetical protein
MIEIKCLRLPSPHVAQPHRYAIRSRFRVPIISVAIALACCPIVLGASTGNIARCGPDMKPLNTGSADFYPSELCTERTAFTGVVSLSIVVDSNGSLKSARIKSSAITPPGSSPCAEFQALQFAKLLRFAAQPSPCRMVFPMKFSVSARDLEGNN